MLIDFLLNHLSIAEKGVLKIQTHKADTNPLDLLYTVHISVCVVNTSIFISLRFILLTDPFTIIQCLCSCFILLKIKLYFINFVLCFLFVSLYKTLQFYSTSDPIFINLMSHDFYNFMINIKLLYLF